MAKEIMLARNASTETLWMFITRPGGEVWDVPGNNWEVWGAGQLANYAITMVQAPSSIGVYWGDFPPVAAGTYVVVIKSQAGGSPAAGDPVAAQLRIEWDGTRIVPLSSRLSPTTEGRTLDVTADGAAGIDWGNIENTMSAVELTNTTLPTVDDVGTTLGTLNSNFDAYISAFNAMVTDGKMESHVLSIDPAVTIPTEFPPEAITDVVDGVFAKVVAGGPALTFEQCIQAIMAPAAGETEIGEDGFVAYRFPGQTTVIVQGTVDEVGNRTDVQYFVAP